MEGIGVLHQKMLDICQRDAQANKIDTGEIVRELEPLFQEYGYREHEEGEPMKILLLTDAGVGDFINCSPAIREVRRTYPQAYITLVVYARSRDMAIACPYVDQLLVNARRCSWFNPIELLSWDISFAKKLLPMHYDVCFNFANYGSSFLLSYLCGAAHRFGYAPENFTCAGPFPYSVVAVFLNHRVPYEKRGTHSVFYYLSLMEKIIGREAKDAHPEVWFLANEKEHWQKRLGEIAPRANWMAVVPGGTDERRHWPVENYQELLGRILEVEHGQEIRFLILGGPADQKDGAWLVEHLPEHAAWNLAGTVNYRESVAALSCCSCYIGNDTGTLHAAAALHLPVLTPNCYPADLPMRSTSVPATYYPYGVPAVMVLPGHALEECRASEDAWGCAQDHKTHCIRQISPALMLQGYRLLKEKMNAGERDTTFLYEAEGAIASGKSIVVQSLSSLVFSE